MFHKYLQLLAADRKLWGKKSKLAGLNDKTFYCCDPLQIITVYQ